VWVTTAKRRPFAAAARMPASTIPTTGLEQGGQLVSSGIAKRADDDRVGTLR
jgi:hypothetical protein